MDKKWTNNINVGDEIRSPLLGVGISDTKVTDKWRACTRKNPDFQTEKIEKGKKED